MPIIIHEDVGEISDIVSSTFEWKLNDFFSLLKRVDESYMSPIFTFGNSTWKFCVYGDGSDFSSAGSCSLALMQKYPRSPKYGFTCTLSIKDKDDRDYMKSMHMKLTTVIKSNIIAFPWLNFVKISKLVEDKDKVAPGGTLTISCSLNCKRDEAKDAQQTTATKSIHECDEGKKESEEATGSDGNEMLLYPRGVELLSQNLKNLFLSKELSDVTVKVKDEEFRAHRAILGAQSSVFQSMFKHDTVERSSGVVDIPDCDPKVFQHFLHYLYSGKVEKKMSAKNVLGLYTVSDKYDTEHLKAECVSFMIKELSVDTICDFITLALMYNESTLLEASTAFFSKNTKNVIVTPQWQSFVKENPIAANELFIKAFEENTN